LGPDEEGAHLNTHVGPPQGAEAACARLEGLRRICYTLADASVACGSRIFIKKETYGDWTGERSKDAEETPEEYCAEESAGEGPAREEGEAGVAKG